MQFIFKIPIALQSLETTHDFHEYNY